MPLIVLLFMIFTKHRNSTDKFLQNLHTLVYEVTLRMSLANDLVIKPPLTRAA